MSKQKNKKFEDPLAIKETRGKFLSKPMIFLFYAAEQFRNLALEERNKWSSSDPIDQNVWRNERIYAGSAFLHYALYCEALLNNVWIDFKKRDVKELPAKLTKDLQMCDDEMLPFKDRLYLTPYLCKENPNYNATYYGRNTNNFQKIVEIFQIRDSYVHAKLTEREIRITIRKDRIHHINDSYGINWWQRTGICKDISLISVVELETIRNSIEWLFSSLNDFLDNSLNNKKWKDEEKISITDGTLFLKNPYKK